VEMVNHSIMAHPMHLHGHAFQVVALNGAPLGGAVRDTVLVPPMGSVTIAFDADNPGRWAFHCHNLYHMMTGMMTELAYPSIIFVISSGAAKITSARSPIIPAGVIAGVPFSGPSLPESVLRRRLRSQNACVFPSAVVTR